MAEASRKPDAGLVASLHEIIATLPGAVPRKMFGCDCFFIGGHCAAGIWRDSAILKLTADDARAITKLPGVTPFMPAEGKPMGGWYVLPHALAREPATLRLWVERAAVLAASSPPKVPKAAAKKSAVVAKAAPVSAKAAKNKRKPGP